MLTETQKEEITRILKRSSRYIWNEKSCAVAIKRLEEFRDGTRDLMEKLPGTNITYEDYYFERDLIKFIKT